MNSSLNQTIQLQQTASDPKNSAWVFASAGSGKTKILTDRVLRLLLADVSPDKILCLTFTKVAAAEMQNRINYELMKWVLCDERQLQKKLCDLSNKFPAPADLKKAQTLLVKILDEDCKIKVQTIHSFCQTLIKIFPFEAKVQPNFEVLEKNQEKMLLKKARKEVLRKAIVSQELRNLIAAINIELHEENFNELLAELLGKKDQLNSLKKEFFGIENVTDQIFKSFSLTKNQNPATIFADFLLALDHKKNLELAAALEKTKSVKNKALASAIKDFLQNPLIENFTNYKLAFFTQKNEPRKVYGQIYGKIADNDFLTDFMTSCQKLILDFADKFNSVKIARNTSSLLYLTDQILKNYSRLKRQNSFLDYNDLIVETNKLLANPEFCDWIKLKMDSSFDHILIDESQDTNHQQWNIIKALSEDYFAGFGAANKNRSIFIVGDEKQSIYSFQGAEPNISSEIFSYFAKKLGPQLKKIELNNSFRSQAKILQAVDEVFAAPQRSKAISKIAAFKNHQPIRDGLGKVEIWPQIQKKTASKSKNYEWKIDFLQKKEPTEQEILAEIIARKISDRVKSKEFLENHAQNQTKNHAKNYSGPLKYSDFMILLRNRTNGFSQALTKFFYQYKIPFNSISNIKFSESLLIQDLLAAAKFTLLPDDDLNLACLLKSPLFEISEADLLEICLAKNSIKTPEKNSEKNPEKNSIYKILEHLAKFQEIKKNLDRLIIKAQQLSCFEFFYYVIYEKSRQQNFIAHFGPEATEILSKFISITFDFCDNSSLSLQKFLEFAEKLDPEIALGHDDNNRVKISTIHSAKGLQALVVIIPDCCYNFNQLLNSRQEISWLEFPDNNSGNHGFSAPKFPLWCKKKDDENRLLKKHRQLKLTEAKEEYLRLLYVAMTRAQDELYIGGFGNSCDPESWYEIIKNSVSCADFIKEEEFLSPAKNADLETLETKGSSEKPGFFKEFLGGQVCEQASVSRYTCSQANLSNNKITKKDSFSELPKNDPAKNPQNNLGISEKSSFSEIPLLQARKEVLLSPDKISLNQISQSQIKGRLIHKILEIIGRNSAEEKSWLLQLAKKIIAKEKFLNTEQKDKIYTKISAFVHSEQFAELFSGTVKCEVEIGGKIENQEIFGRIDLLVEKENEILIVDYKSDETLAKNIVPHYALQLRTYQKLLKNLYPAKKITCAILWLNFLKLELL